MAISTFIVIAKAKPAAISTFIVIAKAKPVAISTDYDTRLFKLDIRRK